MPPEILTSDELAARLKANPETIRRQTRDGKLPALRLGGEYRYDWGAVFAALQTPNALREAVAYLDANPLNAICSGSALHKAMADALRGAQ